MKFLLLLFLSIILTTEARVVQKNVRSVSPIKAIGDFNARAKRDAEHEPSAEEALGWLAKFLANQGNRPRRSEDDVEVEDLKEQIKKLDRMEAQVKCLDGVADRVMRENISLSTLQRLMKQCENI